MGSFQGGSHGRGRVEATLAGFTASRDPWGSRLGRSLGRPAAWPGRVLCPLSLCQGSRDWANGSREGRASSGRLFKQQHPRGWPCARGARPPHGAGSGPSLPPGGPGTAAMRSQESMRGSPRPGPGWVGRGSRKVLRIWVSGWCGARRAGPGRGCYEHPNTAFAACRMLPVGWCQRCRGGN